MTAPENKSNTESIRLERTAKDPDHYCLGICVIVMVVIGVLALIVTENIISQINYYNTTDDYISEIASIDVTL